MTKIKISKSFSTISIVKQYRSGISSFMYTIFTDSETRGTLTTNSDIRMNIK